MSSAVALQPSETDKGYTQSRKGSGLLSAHPQRQKIIDAILKGDSSVQIHKWVAPPVSRQMIGQLAKQVRDQREAALILEKAQQLQALTNGGQAKTMDVDRLARDAVMGQSHIARIEKLLEPLERQAQLADAENDRNGLSSVAKAALSAIRTQAELDGSLLSTTVNQTVNTTVLMLPFSGSTEPEAPAIDTTAEPA